MGSVLSWSNVLAGGKNYGKGHLKNLKEVFGTKLFAASGLLGGGGEWADNPQNIWGLCGKLAPNWYQRGFSLLSYLLLNATNQQTKWSLRMAAVTCIEQETKKYVSASKYSLSQYHVIESVGTWLQNSQPEDPTPNLQGAAWNLRGCLRCLAAGVESIVSGTLSV